MSITDVSCIQHEYMFKTKLVISRELLQLSNEFYKTLKTISEIDSKKIEQLNNIKRILELFYEDNSIYKEYMDSWSNALDSEIKNLEQSVALFNSTGNFTYDIKQAYEELLVS